MGSTKNVLEAYHALVARSMAASITSPVTSIKFLDNCMIQLNFTGVPVGTFAVQVSADYNQDSFGNVINAGNWVALPLSPSPIASGAADQIIIDMNEMPAPWMRVVYTRTSGTGALDMYVTAKMI